MEQVASHLHHIPRNMWRTKERTNFSLEGLICYLPLWHPELANATFNSKDLNAHACSVTGAVWGITGRTFDGTGDFVTVPDHAVLSALTKMTVEIWVKLATADAKAFMVLAAKYYHATDREWTFYATSSRLADTAELKSPRFNVYDQSANAFMGGWLTTKTDLFDGLWHHLVFIWNGSVLAGGITAVLDGASVGFTDGISGTFVAVEDGVRPVMLGRQENLTARDCKGIIGEFRQYNRNLSLAEAQHNRLATMWRYR